MKKYLVYFMLLVPLFAYAEEKGAEESSIMVELMVVAKATGMWPFFMSRLHKTCTKMILVDIGFEGSKRI